MVWWTCRLSTMSLPLKCGQRFGGTNASKMFLSFPNKTALSLPTAQPQAVAGEEPVPAPYRYKIKEATGSKTNCFKPNSIDGQDMMNLKHQIAGACFKNNFHKLCRNKKASVVWEVAPLKICRCFWLLLVTAENPSQSTNLLGVAKLLRV